MNTTDTKPLPPAAAPPVLVQQTALIPELQSRTCQCGRGKRSGRPFCLGCYRRLPADVQKGLYRRIGRGYEQAREKAQRYL